MMLCELQHYLFIISLRSIPFSLNVCKLAQTRVNQNSANKNSVQFAFITAVVEFSTPKYTLCVCTMCLFIFIHSMHACMYIRDEMRLFLALLFCKLCACEINDNK